MFFLKLTKQGKLSFHADFCTYFILNVFFINGLNRNVSDVYDFNCRCFAIVLPSLLPAMTQAVNLDELLLMFCVFCFPLNNYTAIKHTLNLRAV